MSLKEKVREIVCLLLGIAIAVICIFSVNRSNRTSDLKSGFISEQVTVASGLPGSDTEAEQVVSKTYYFDPITHEMVKGEQEIDGNWYYFDTDTGVMLTGFCEADVNGDLYTFDKAWDEAILSENESLDTYEGRTLEVQKTRTIYYYDENGRKVFGIESIDDNTYLFDLETGKMIVGFYEYYGPDEQGNLRKRYYDEYGHLVFGFRDIDGYRYYFEPETGNMKTGFKYFEDMDRVVCFDKEGHMLFGEQDINGYRYKFDDETGEKIWKRKLQASEI